jgi:hypothetical protein
MQQPVSSAHKVAGGGAARMRGRSASRVGGALGAPPFPPLVVRALADVLDARATAGLARARVVALCHVRRGFAGCERGADGSVGEDHDGSRHLRTADGGPASQR